jgi:hypothetical protein
MSADCFFGWHQLKQAPVAPSGAKKQAYHIKQVQEDHLVPKRLPAQVEKLTIATKN